MNANLLATVGMSEHQFTRLVTWLDSWIARNEGVSGFVQYGSSAPPRHAAGSAVVSPDRVLDSMTRAFVVVTHGGPGSIMDARARGHVPVVVPRIAALDEHVDDHQVVFTRSLASTGWIHLAETEAALHDHLDNAYLDGSTYRHTSRASREVPAVAPLKDVLVDVTRRRAGFFHVRRARHVIDYYRQRRRG